MMSMHERVAVLQLAEIVLEMAQKAEPQDSPGLLWSDRVQSAIRGLIDEPVEAPGNAYTQPVNVSATH